MSDGTKGNTAIAVAIVGAVSAIGVAWITAGGVARDETNRVINEAESQLKILVGKTTKLENKVNAISGKCPRAITSQNFGNVKVYSQAFESKGEKSVELLNINGAGCLITGSILGYAFINENAGTNYTITLEIDGIEQTYPPKTEGGIDVRSYAQDAGNKNTGVLVLPSIRFKSSLRIKYFYPGGSKEISSYALVLLDSSS